MQFNFWTSPYLVLALKKKKKKVLSDLKHRLHVVERPEALLGIRKQVGKETWVHVNNTGGDRQGGRKHTHAKPHTETKDTVKVRI